MISTSSEYAMQAVLHLAEGDCGEVVAAAEMAEALGLPANYLSKILHGLRRAGVLESERGRFGGFRLARPAAEIALAEVIEPFDSPGRRRCLLGRSECSDAEACSVHEAWKAAYEPVRLFFQDTRVADLLKESGFEADDGTPNRRRAAGRDPVGGTS